MRIERQLRKWRANAPLPAYVRQEAESLQVARSSIFSVDTF